MNLVGRRHVSEQISRQRSTARQPLLYGLTLAIGGGPSGASDAVRASADGSETPVLLIASKCGFHFGWRNLIGNLRFKLRPRQTSPRSLIFCCNQPRASGFGCANSNWRRLYRSNLFPAVASLLSCQTPDKRALFHLHWQRGRYRNRR